MKTTTINTSKEMNAYSDYPPPKHFANFMHNTQMLAYLKLYADHHNLVPHIRFRHAVTGIRRADDFDQSGNWIVEYNDELVLMFNLLITSVTYRNDQHYVETFNAVLLCNGHHALPNMPVWPNQHAFKGTLIHSHSYRDDRPYIDQRVIVVGVGSSGIDLAVELSRCGKQVHTRALIQ
jgi:dimethylaniline monooxygenase (N-oxide forming)